jgi:hypothetical protein
MNPEEIQKLKEETHEAIKTVPLALGDNQEKQ